MHFAVGWNDCQDFVISSVRSAGDELPGMVTVQLVVLVESKVFQVGKKELKYVGDSTASLDLKR